MRTFLVLSFVIRMVVVSGFSVKRNHLLGLSNKEDPNDITQLSECLSMETVDGNYQYISPGGHSVCGFYMVGDPDQNIEIIFHQVDVTCSNGGILAIVDGWEANQFFFPGDWDYAKPSSQRYQTYCGANTPRVFRSSQNVALIQMRIPWKGEGFKISVRFIKNEHPCNVISMPKTGEYTLMNGGRKVNCSFALMAPQYIQIEKMDVGRVPSDQDFPGLPLEQSITNRCSDDTVEFLDGTGLDPSYLFREGLLCGTGSISSKQAYGVYLPCPQSVVRLVSSGHFSNAIKFHFRPMTKWELGMIGEVEC